MKKLLVLIILLFIASTVVAHGNKHKIIVGSVSTGANILLGKPIWEFPQPWGRLAETVVGEYNPGADDPIPLTPSTPLDAVLASRVSQGLIDEFGLASPHNVPLSDTLTAVEADLTLGSLPKHRDADINEASSARPTITLGDWLKAEGIMSIKCKKDGSAKLKMEVLGLIPNGLYTLWQTRGLSDGGIAAVPAGGIPNFVVPNEKGKAKYKRKLAHCPLNFGENSEPVLMYELALHHNAMVYGAVPDLPLLGRPFGLETATQITFGVVGERIRHD